MKGYDKSPDYGGPEPPKWFWALALLFLIGLPIGLVLLARFA
jgi:hypothetical protein